MNTALNYSQRGITLIIGLVMLVLITLMVTGAFKMSTSNLRSVGNMQYRNEALAAANVAIEQVISSAAIFTNPVVRSIVVGSYTVTVAKPACLYATDITENSSADSNPNIVINSGAFGSGAGSSYQNTYWDIAATVNDNMSGTLVTVHQGIKITLPSSPNPCS